MCIHVDVLAHSRCGVHSYTLLDIRKSKSVSTHYTHLVGGSQQAGVSVAALNWLFNNVDVETAFLLKTTT